MNAIKRRRQSWRRWAATGLMGLVGAAGIIPAQAAPWHNRFEFAAPAFREVWTASDLAVQNGSIARSYTWGPQAWWDYKEYYRQSPNGLRQVQYFDKARMEINNPSIGGVRGVTNGLLTVELVSGRLKTGDATGFEDNQQRQPATVPVAGDPGVQNLNAPTYASFQGVATVDNGYRDPDQVGQRVGATLDKQGNRTNNPTLAQDPATEIVSYNTITGHNIPRIFRDFFQNGPVDALFAFGYPITDPYWVRARVGGVEKDIFVQLYERRIVTYTPSNPAAFRVEMGNVGQHYFQWRYPHLGQPWLQADPSAVPIAFASMRATADHWETFLMEPNATNVRQITNNTAETVPYSWRRSYVEGQTPRLMTDSKRDAGARQLFSVDLYNQSDVRQHTTGSGAIAFNGAVSPDGTQIAAAAQAGDLTSISLIPFGRDRSYIPPTAPMERACRYESPSWLPDGSGLVFAANCDGKFAIYRADIQYMFAPTDDYISASIVGLREVARATNADNYYPRVSPSGEFVIFTSNRNGADDLYLVRIDGTGETRLTTGSAGESGASWSPEGREIVYDSNVDGDYEIFKAGLTDGRLVNVTQLTYNTVDDRWALWGQ